MRGIWNWATGNTGDKQQQEFLLDLNDILGVKNAILTKQIEQQVKYIISEYENNKLEKYSNIKTHLISLLPDDTLPTLSRQAVHKKDNELIDKLLDADRFNTPFDDDFAELTLELFNDKNELLDKLIKNRKLALNDLIIGGVRSVENYIFEEKELDKEFLDIILSNPNLKLDEAKSKAIVEFIIKPDSDLSDKLQPFKTDLINYIVSNGKWEEFSALHNKNFITKDDMAPHANAIYKAIRDKKLSEDLINDISDKVKIEQAFIKDRAIEGDLLNLIKGALDEHRNVDVTVLFEQLKNKGLNLDDVVIRHQVNNKTILGEIVDHLETSTTILSELLELPINAEEHINRITNYFLEHEDTANLIKILNDSQTDSAKTIKIRFINGLIQNHKDDIVESFYNEGLFQSEIEIALNTQKDEIALDLYQGGQTNLLNFKLNNLKKSERFLDINLQNRANLLELACFNGHDALVDKLIPHANGNHKKEALTYLAISKNPEKSAKILGALKINESFGLTKTTITKLYILAYENGNNQFAEKIASVSNGVTEGFRKELISLTLVKAINDGNFECVKALLANNPDFEVGTVVTITKFKDNSETRESVEPLFLAAAAEKNSNELLDVLLERAKSRNELNIRNENGHNILQVSILKYSHKLANKILENNDKELVESLINYEVKGQGTAFNHAFYQISQLEKEIVILAAQKNPALQAQITEKQSQIKGFYQFLNNVLANPGFDIDKSLKVAILQKGDSKGFKANVLTDTYESIIDILESTPDIKEDDPQIEHKLDLLKNIMQKDKLDVNTPNEHQQSILMLAAKAGDSELSAEILSHKNLNINAVDKYGSSALFYAAQSGNEAIVRSITDNGGNISHINNDGANIVMAAANGANPELLKHVLEKNNISLNARDNNGNNALHYAINSNEIRSAKLFARGELRKNINEQAGKIREDLLETLISQGIDIDAQNKDGRTPLIDAALKGDTATVKMLIKHGADVNKADKYGNTALIYTCFSNNTDLINALTYESKLDINHRNNDGLSAYSIAAARSGIENFGKVQKSLAGLEDNEDQIAIARLSQKMNKVVGGNKEIVRLLIDRGADPYDTEPATALWKKLLVTGAVATSLSAANGLLLATNPLAKEVGQTMIATGAGYAVYSQVSGSVENALAGWMKEDTEWDVKMNNKFMIGSYHVNTWGAVSYGQGLKNMLVELGRVKPNSQIIFGVDKEENQPLEEAQNLFKKQLQDLDAKSQIELHETLQFKYVRIKYKLDNQFLLPWTRIQLGNVLQEIELADQALMREKMVNNRDLPNRTSFEQHYADAIRFLSSDKSREVVIRGLLENKNDINLNSINNLVNNVLNSEIFVSPATYYKCLQFKEQQKQIEKNYDPNPGIFTRIYLYITGRNYYYGKTMIPSALALELFKTPTDNIKKEAGKVATIEKMDQQSSVKTYKEEAISAFAKLAGQEPEEFIANSASMIGKVVGAAAGVNTALGMDNKSIIVAQGAIGIASTIGGAAVTALLPFALPGVAIGGAGYLAYQHSGTLTEKASSWYNWLFPAHEVKQLTLREEMDNFVNQNNITHDDEALLEANRQEPKMPKTNNIDANIVNKLADVAPDAIENISNKKMPDSKQVFIG